MGFDTIKINLVVAAKKSKKKFKTAEESNLDKRFGTLRNHENVHNLVKFQYFEL